MSCARVPAESLDTSVKAWISARDRADEILQEWQRLESELIRDHGYMSARQAARCGISQGRSMRLLDLHYRTLSRTLDREARVLSAVRPTRLADAVAKIELGLRMQDEDPDDGATAMIRDGFQALRHFLCEEPAAEIPGGGVDGMNRSLKL